MVPPERIARVQELLKTVKHVAIATVNEDGSPHNTPVFAAVGDDLRLYWASHPASVHSQNIARTGQVFVVFFDSVGEGGGLFVQARAVEVAGADIPEALEVFNTTRQRLLREAITVQEVSGRSPQRLYCATPEHLWVNMAERDAAGHVVRDRRYEVTVKELA